MQSVSALYTQIMEGGGWHEVKLEINGVAYGMDKIVDMSTSHALFDGSVSVGNTIAGTIDVGLIAKSSSIPIMAQLRPYVRATDGTQVSEWIPRGVYWIDTREYDHESGIVKLTGFDAMLKGEQDYMGTGDQGTWPQVDINILCEIADRLDLGKDVYTRIASPSGNPKESGWYYYSSSQQAYVLSTATTPNPNTSYYVRSNTGIDERTLPLIDKSYKIGYPGFGEGAYTVREVLGFIGAMYAGNWIINDQGKLRLIVVGDIPPETNYLITENNDTIIIGGYRIRLT